MKTDELRRKYLQFFEFKEHRVMPSDSLVPQNDPTLLFTGAGMNQFKDYFLGLKKNLRRAATSQKCLRTGDLEEVGKTAFHHSFFEMLGNFSFGDYFKREAIHWAWEFLTKELAIPVQRLRVSVHKDDQESYLIWRDEIKIRPDWIYPLGDKSNFWPANAPADGPNGPCGPCSEIYYDQRPSEPTPGFIDDGTGRFAEIWNLVFTQFDRQDGGILIPLAQKNIDTGMGLERLACVMQGVTTNYEIDIFRPINFRVEELLGFKSNSIQAPMRQNLYAISDHLRAVIFCIADGVIPSNEGRGYVIRKLIRRALWRAHQIVAASGKEMERPFMFEAVDIVIQMMKTAYPELQELSAGIISAIRSEEERFLTTLETGLKILENKIAQMQKRNQSEIPGTDVFELYDTYGFPEELTRMIADSRGLKIDLSGFAAQMEQQRKRAKEATQISSSIFSATELEKKISGLSATVFKGYESLEVEASILLVENQGDQAAILLDQTPFYGESGGQVGDQGILQGDSFEAQVIDTQKKDKHVLHFVKILKDSPKIGLRIKARVDTARRFHAMRNHTATHLLHAALRNLLGTQVRQLGSLVSPEKLRFDYAYGQALTLDQITQLELAVNQEILACKPVRKEEKPLEEAKKEGAIAFFGEKYGEKVRIVTIPGFSKEFCGGTHCESTGQIGSFVIVSESSIASGTRRIEALTGEAALRYTQNLRGEIQGLSAMLKTTPELIGDRVTKMQETLRKLEKDKKKAQVSKADPDRIIQESKNAGQLKFAAFRDKDLEAGELRMLSDEIADKSRHTVYFLATETSEKIQFLIGLSHDLRKRIAESKLNWSAQDIAKVLSPILQSSGGGRKELIQGGAANKGQLQNQWEQILQTAIQYLSERSL